MSWRDREYARGGGYGAPAFWHHGRSVVNILIWANIAIFVICTLTGGRKGAPDSMLFGWMALHTPSVQEGQIWRLFTAQYLHWNFIHILFNMIGLHFLGRPLEIDWGRKQFLAVYTVAGLVGNLFYVALTLIGWLEMEGVAAGASGGVLALLGAAAVRYPHAEVLIYFLFPIKIRTAALVFGGLYALNLYARGANAGGDACHLAGMLFGAWWAYRGEGWWRRHGWRLPSLRIRRRYIRPSSFAERVEQRRADAVTVDRILRKVYESGIHSLSESEKQALREATERQKAMESGFTDRI